MAGQAGVCFCLLWQETVHIPWYWLVPGITSSVYHRPHRHTLPSAVI